MGVKKDAFLVLFLCFASVLPLLFLCSSCARSVRCVRSTPTQQGGAEGELRKT